MCESWAGEKNATYLCLLTCRFHIQTFVVSKVAKECKGLHIFLFAHFTHVQERCIIQDATERMSAVTDCLCLILYKWLFKWLVQMQLCLLPQIAEIVSHTHSNTKCKISRNRKLMDIIDIKYQARLLFGLTCIGSTYLDLKSQLKLQSWRIQQGVRKLGLIASFATYFSSIGSH